MEFFEITSIAEVAFMSDVYKRYLWAYLVIGACIYAVLYILKSIALFTIAGREGFKNKWMAFVPFFNTYYIGVVSDKNNVFKAKAKTVSLIAAIVEAVYCALSILYFVAMFLIFRGGYAVPEYTPMVYYGSTPIDILTGYTPSEALPASLNWAWWVFANMQDYILYWVQLAYTIIMVFLLVSFFRTYAASRYVLFSVLSVLFPISAIFMFVVRNNRGTNYMEYLRERQQRQYRMYQEYMRNNGQNMDGQGGSFYGGNTGNPYEQPRPSAPPEDPFGGLGSDSNNKDGGNGGNGGGSADPFDEFKN